VGRREALASRQRWTALSVERRELLTGKLVGLWYAPSDAAAFDSWAIDKQQALVLFIDRLTQKGLWHLVKQVSNVYGEGGVGLEFLAWPMIDSTLRRRKDFTRLFATHKGTLGGFYEKGRREAVLHFLFKEGEPQQWSVHFDLYSPVYSLASALKHMRYEVLGRVTPDWRAIRRCLNT
jgi:hypothetical protein